MAPRQNSQSGHCHNNHDSGGIIAGFNKGFDDTYSNSNPYSYRM
jgi:hypothetical protein